MDTVAGGDDAGFRLDEVDFDGVHEGRPLLSGTDVPFEVAPWGIGGPRPAVVALADELRGEVLDAGCGLGENAVFLAGRGLRATGVLHLLCVAHVAHVGSWRPPPSGGPARNGSAKPA